MRKRILDGNTFKTMLVLSGPIMFNQIVQVIYNIIDTFWLGRLGKVAISAPAVTWPLIFTAGMFTSGFVTAGLALVSQYVGANKWEKVDRVVAQLTLAILGIAISFALLGLVFARGVLSAMGVPMDVLPYATIYLQTIALFFPIMFFGYVFSISLRSIGDTKTPMLLNLVAITMNIILDPILIFGFGPIPSLGVFGAALATSLSNTFFGLTGFLVFLTGRKHIKLRPEDFQIDMPIITKITRIGTPQAIGNSLIGLGFTIVMAIVSSFGTVAVAAYGIGMRIINLISAVSFGISQAAAVMVGQNLGADQPERARKILHLAVKTTFAIMAGIAVVVFALASGIVQFFISDPDVIRVGTNMIAIFSLSVPFIGVFFPVMQALRAAGKTKISAMLGIIRLWFIRIPLVFGFSTLLGLVGIWWGLASSNLVSAAVAAYFLINTSWLEKIIE